MMTFIIGFKFFYLRFNWYLFIEHEYVCIFLATFKSVLVYAIFNNVFDNI
jgi:hypothetical protein